jgi:hypothetical protein
VVEPQLLEAPLQVPVRLGREQHVRVDGANGSDDLAPVLRFRRRAHSIAPGAREHVAEQQHGHVATHAVGLVPDVHEGRSRGTTKSGRERVELGDVGPGREERVAAPGDHVVVDGEERGRIDVGLPVGASYEVVGVFRQPGMVGRDMVRYEVDDETDAALGKGTARHRQPGAPAEALVDLVAPDAVRRPDHIGVAEIRERRPEAGQQVGGVERVLPPCRAALPDAHQPHGVHARRRHVVPLDVGDIGQRRGGSSSTGDVVEPCRGVDLEDDRVARPHGHSSPPGCSAASSIRAPLVNTRFPCSPVASRSSGRR